MPTGPAGKALRWLRLGGPRGAPSARPPPLDPLQRRSFYRPADPTPAPCCVPATGPAAGGSPTPSTPPPAHTPEPQAPSPQEASSFPPSLKPPSKPLLWGRPVPHLLPSLPRPCSAPRDLRATKPACRCPLQLSLSPWGSLVCRCPTWDPCPGPSDLLPTSQRLLLHPLTCQRS